MTDDRFFGPAETELGRELAKIAGVELTPRAEGTPEERRPLVKQASMEKRATDLSLREIFNDENFQRGVGDAIESMRYLWEPMMEKVARQRLGLE